MISMGPAGMPETWSGVPYFLLSELRRRGIIVYEVDLEPHHYIKWLYNKVIMPLVSLFVTKGELSIYRSLFFRIYQYVVLQNKLRKYDSADLVLGVSSFNIAVPKSSKPVVLFSDWPFSYDLLRKKIEVGFYQNCCLKEEDRCMKNADILISLFPTCAKYINQRLGLEKARYLGVNVVNNMGPQPTSELILNKCNKCRIVFIGRHHYLPGAILLLNAYCELLGSIPDIELDVIGLRSSDFPVGILDKLNENVRFWGYLDKGIPEQRKIYYDILSNASLYVNTTAGWVGYTSMIEAMFFYTPVLVYPCVEFLDEFGDSVDFGVYADTDSPLLLAKYIKDIWTDENYCQMAKSAHCRVENYTWPQFVDRLIDVSNAVKTTGFRVKSK